LTNQQPTREEAFMSKEILLGGAPVRLAVIGLGYVGLPLAAEFGKTLPVVGFDIKQERIDELKGGRDNTLEVDEEELAAAKHLSYTADLDRLRACNVFIVTVPTPVDAANRPDLTPLVRASETVGKVMPKGSVVIYESTVYPGATEEVCVPVLERFSGLTHNVDFYSGYSPERINPGDKEHRLTTIKKVTAGSTPAVADFVDELYARVIVAGTHKASSIKVAEAAKVIENTQRDVNIALMNELSLIFARMGIDTLEVLQAAGTKWNFLPFRPGLVGGHCIGVDPYYLTHKAQELGYHAEVILAGRRINDGMGAHVAGEVIKLMARKGIATPGARVLVLGFTFKEGCPDVRNTKVIDIVRELASYGLPVDIYDPWINVDEAEHEYGVRPLADLPGEGAYDAVVLAVAHPQFKAWGAARIHAFGKPRHVLYDVKSLLGKNETDGRL
jgi:UDP-N-acetyl-D-galactosamine dehydrogenase